MPKLVFYHIMNLMEGVGIYKVFRFTRWWYYGKLCYYGLEFFNWMTCCVGAIPSPLCLINGIVLHTKYFPVTKRTVHDNTRRCIDKPEFKLKIYTQHLYPADKTWGISYGCFAYLCTLCFNIRILESVGFASSSHSFCHRLFYLIWYQYSCNMEEPHMWDVFDSYCDVMLNTG